MVIRTISTNLLQIVSKVVFHFKVTVTSIKDADDNFLRNS